MGPRQQVDASCERALQGVLFLRLPQHSGAEPYQQVEGHNLDEASVYTWGKVQP